jgi:hypothetical protein
MAQKDKIGIVLGLVRRNSSPTFYAMLPQVFILFLSLGTVARSLLRRRKLMMEAGLSLQGFI